MLLSMMLNDMTPNQRRRYRELVTTYVELKEEVIRHVDATVTDGRFASPRSSLNPQCWPGEKERKR